MKGNFAQNCEEIARWIHEHRDNVINDWILCGRWRLCPIAGAPPLFGLLQDGVQRRNNWLMFEGDPFDESTITVTHFGPIGLKNQKETEDKSDKVKKLITKEMNRHGLNFQRGRKEVGKQTKKMPMKNCLRKQSEEDIWLS